MLKHRVALVVSTFLLSSLSIAANGDPSEPPTLTLTSPNGGEVIDTGSLLPVRWSLAGEIAEGTLSDVFISLYKDGVYVQYIGSTQATDLEFTWEVCPWFAEGGGYAVRISCYTSTFSLEDLSDATFAMHAAKHPSLTVISPTAGETLTPGEPITLRWTSRDLGGILLAGLYQGDVERGSLGVALVESGEIQTTLCPVLPRGDDYRIKISFPEQGCDSFFVYSPLFSVTDSSQSTWGLLSPRGGEVFDAGSWMNVEWQRPEIYASLSAPQFYLSRGSNWARRLDCWQLMPGRSVCELCSTLPEASDYEVASEVFDCSGIAWVTSAGTFSVRNPTPPSIHLLSPNGGETVRGDQPLNIRWNSTGVQNMVEANLYRNGAFNSHLGQAAAALGQMMVSLCPLVENGDGYTVGVAGWSSCGDSEPHDWSDAPFEIVGAQTQLPLTLTGPAPGSEFPLCGEIPITWTGFDSSTVIAAWLARNGSELDCLGEADPRAGQMVGRLRGFYEPGDDYYILLEASNNCGSTGPYRSGYITIVSQTYPPPTLAITSFSGGEVVTAGSRQKITWTAEGAVGSVRIYMTNGVQGQYVDDVPAAAGCYEWNVCPTLGDGVGYSVALSVCSCRSCVEVRTDSFTVSGSVPDPRVTLNPVNDGQPVQAGETVLITWNAENPRGLLNLVIRNGRDIPLASVPMAAGSYEWQVCLSLPSGIYEIEAYWDGCGYSLGTNSYSVVIVGPAGSSADLDYDCDVDADDVAIFKKCVTGPGIVYDVYKVDPEVCHVAPNDYGFLEADLDRDGDVDQTDFGILQGSLTGPLPQQNH